MFDRKPQAFTIMGIPLIASPWFTSRRSPSYFPVGISNPDVRCLHFRSFFFISSSWVCLITRYNYTFSIFVEHPLSYVYSFFRFNCPKKLQSFSLLFFSYFPRFPLWFYSVYAQSKIFVFLSSIPLVSFYLLSSSVLLISHSMSKLFYLNHNITTTL